VGVDVVPALVGVLDAGVEVVAGVVVAEVLGVELLLLLPPLPHPAMSAPQSSATASNGDRLPNIGPP
jgi:hypothetical protein